MKILFLHGWTSVPGGRKPSHLESHGHRVANPSLPDEDFECAVQIAQTVFNADPPDVVVGSSRGGAVAMNLESRSVPLVLLCPAWRRWGKASRTKGRTVVLHSRADDVVPYADSEFLVKTSGLGPAQLVEVGHDHRLADPASLAALVSACEQTAQREIEVAVFHLEMRAPPNTPPPAAREGVQVLEVSQPAVSYYRYLYHSVGCDYHWESRGALPDTLLTESLQDPQHLLYVLHVYGSPAGFAELDLRNKDEVELVQFGLFPAYIGQGLGSWFLGWTIDKVWRNQPSRFWLHTCTLDHPVAVPNYLRHGFRQFAEEKTIRRLPPLRENVASLQSQQRSSMRNT